MPRWPRNDRLCEACTKDNVFVPELLKVRRLSVIIWHFNRREHFSAHGEQDVDKPLDAAVILSLPKLSPVQPEVLSGIALKTRPGTLAMPLAPGHPTQDSSSSVPVAGWPCRALTAQGLGKEARPTGCLFVCCNSWWNRALFHRLVSFDFWVSNARVHRTSSTRGIPSGSPTQMAYESCRCAASCQKAQKNCSCSRTRH